MSQIRLIAGVQLKGRWGEWRRRDTVLVNGRELAGFIQIRRRYFGRRLGHRIECLTLHGDTAVIGRDIKWLLAQSGITQATRD